VSIDDAGFARGAGKGRAPEAMKATRYFTEQVLPRRTYLTEALCRTALAAPLRRETQPDGRIRAWGEAFLPGETDARILRVVTLEDGETLHNAFLDRGYRRDEA
jgi:hypothetical protein